MYKMLKAAAITLPLVFGTALADDSQNLLGGMTEITPMSEMELSAVVGGSGGACAICALNNIAGVTQVNISALSALVAQANQSSVSQSNN